MSTQKESIWAILSGIGGIATVLSLILYVHASRSPSASTSLTTNTTTDVMDDTPSGETGTTVGSAAEEPKKETPSPLPPRSEMTPRELPAEFTLSDGDQKVLLSGQASVGIQFNQIGEERFLTLRINSSEGSENHPILGTGGRFPFRQAGSEYYVSVLRFDHAARTAVLRVDKARK